MTQRPCHARAYLALALACVLLRLQLLDLQFDAVVQLTFLRLALHGHLDFALERHTFLDPPGFCAHGKKSSFAIVFKEGAICSDRGQVCFSCLPGGALRAINLLLLTISTSELHVSSECVISFPNIAERF